MNKSVLIYNWVQFDNPNMDGGGVSVYIKNVIEALLERGVKVVFLSAGYSYTSTNHKPFVEETDNVFRNEGVTSYRIVNSPVKAPAHDSFGDLLNARENMEIANIFIDFMGKHGPFEEVHFHNIEGISTVLFQEIKKKTNAKIAYWLHNYHPICPQIELFKDGKELCVDNHDGADCFGCLAHIPDKKETVENRVRARQNGSDNTVVLKKVNLFNTAGVENTIRDILRLSLAPFYLLIQLIKYLRLAMKRKVKKISVVMQGYSVLAYIYRQYRKLRKEVRMFLGLQPRDPKGGNKLHAGAERPHWQSRMKEKTDELNYLTGLNVFYKEWRNINIVRLNHDVDYLYAVSEQVKERYVDVGVYADKIQVTPLGMDLYFQPESRRQSYLVKDKVDKLRVGYFGYPIASKGLAYLIESIQQIDDTTVLENIELRIHSRLDGWLFRKLCRINPILGSVKILDGYKRDEIHEIAKNLDLVVVPSLVWETFNQVSYEMIMLGVPVIVSDTIGIKFAVPDKFIFKSHDTNDLAEKISYFVKNRVELGDFWSENQEKSHHKLISMQEHLDLVLGSRFPRHQAVQRPKNAQRSNRDLVVSYANKLGAVAKKSQLIRELKDLPTTHKALKIGRSFAKIVKA